MPHQRTYFHTFTRDDDSEVTLEYTYHPGEPASYDDPGYGPEIEIVSILDDTLTEAEDERACSEISEQHEDDSGPDPDDLRDAAIDRKLTEG